MNLPDMLAFLVGGGITLTAFITLVERIFPSTATKCAEAIKIFIMEVVFDRPGKCRILYFFSCPYV